MPRGHRTRVEFDFEKMLKTYYLLGFFSSETSPNVSIDCFSFHRPIAKIINYYTSPYVFTVKITFLRSMGIVSI